MSGAHTKEAAPKGRHIVGRAVLPRFERGYYGTLVICGFPYLIDISRLGDGVLVLAYDAPKDAAQDKEVADGATGEQARTDAAGDRCGVSAA